MPAHEEQGPDYWRIDPTVMRDQPFGAHTALTREPDSIDLFAAETGASLAETIYLIGDDLAPEVRQRVRQEVERHIFKPYLAYGRKHWWFKGALNWNGVVNGSIGLAFLRLEQDVQTLAEALSMVLEGFEAYIATGFEADGGSIEGVGYWNYGLMYYVTVAELLREISGGELDLLANPRLKDIAYYPVGMALKPPHVPQLRRRAGRGLPRRRDRPEARRAHGRAGTARAGRQQHPARRTQLLGRQAADPAAPDRLVGRRGLRRCRRCAITFCRKSASSSWSARRATSRSCWR